METRIVKVEAQGLGRFRDAEGPERLSNWEIASSASGVSIAALRDAAEYMRTKDTPVAFPTETVYGLGADATRSGAVKGIYSAKGRPSDNPLISHVCDLDMLRGLLLSEPQAANGDAAGKDPIPEIYKPLIEKFWPGPLTILLRNPEPSKFAPEVTAGLASFGVRMPSSPLALTLIKLAGVPLAAPSANASTKPSPTTAQHVYHDLEGRIELILDGGACQVGVESTVVDGLCDPPVVLRPGGVSMEELRSCDGWEGVVKAYKDESETGKSAPRAPGMKYKHYSPKAKVVLYEWGCEAGAEGVVAEDLQKALIQQNGDVTATNGLGPTTLIKIGIIRTRRWKTAGGLHHGALQVSKVHVDGAVEVNARDEAAYEVQEGELQDAQEKPMATILDIGLGDDTRGIAQGLFSALRDLDRRGASVIFVDGIDDRNDIAEAVMNRLRKAASEIRA
ncbi:translation initiation protein Sua5 [Colletotrichum tofieldiae]|uniref:Threonylcarbamoyl-AMP synthase n=1 Tax=Colletotrichum tofieldiae TaxID=708197 RepID=A0A166UYI2_9PEZI|nr:translation initiation protein Sua5 (yrdC protein) [Colletotrichum tofieldiae]GKT55133.1 translation initiation protein Sua5 [Colletotrichum tofieldiae]GKT75580.1 translation initiation protein Sua5 [Colletotrichum tofieldiae]